MKLFKIQIVSLVKLQKFRLLW